MTISVIIPVKNGAATLGRCLDSIRNQTVDDIEIIILDSMSTDGSREIALANQAKLVDIPAGSFDHGLTRNTGVQHATNELVFLTVQDAWIADKDMFKNMSAHFMDAAVMGVSGHQAIPHEADKNPFKWYRRFSQPVVEKRSLKNTVGFKDIDASKLQAMIAWDNVVAMYRKTALMELPFVRTEMSEDWVWSRDALLKGWTLVYDPSLLVHHYHHESFGYVYRVSYSVHYHFYTFFGFKPAVPALLSQMARASWHLGKHPELSFSKKIGWILHNYKSMLAKFIASIDFLLNLKLGGAAAIKKRYASICKTIPQGTQNLYN